MRRRIIVIMELKILSGVKGKAVVPESHDMLVSGDDDTHLDVMPHAAIAKSIFYGIHTNLLYTQRSHEAQP